MHLSIDKTPIGPLSLFGHADDEYVQAFIVPAMLVTLCYRSFRVVEHLHYASSTKTVLRMNSLDKLLAIDPLVLN